MRHRLAAIAAGTAFAVLSTLASGPVVHADQNGNNQNTEDNRGGDGHGPKLNVNPAATPELDSLLLFGLGSLGVGGYVLRRRSLRKRP